ncbi:unnamed protein product, partial [Symbiodinium necroappetens]
MLTAARPFLGKPDSREADEVAQGLWEEALERAQDGAVWLFGVQQEDRTRAIREADEVAQGLWEEALERAQDGAGRLFGVQQEDRTRAIDDLRASLGNDIDVDAHTARKFLEAVASRKQAGQRQIVGRTLDLKSAYERLASAPCDGWGEHSGGLATGRTAVSVLSICYFAFWCSALGCSFESSGEDVEEHIVFSMLGASFSLIKTLQGILEISNKGGRLQALRSLVNSVCAEGFVQHAVLASLKGRFLYASTHTFGRVAVMAVKCLSRYLAGGDILKLNNEDCTLLQRTIDLLEDMRSREIRAGTGGVPVVTVTDGAHKE